MTTKHDGDFGSGDIVLADGSVRIEDDAEREFGICGEGDGAGDEVAEAVDGEERRV